MTDRPPVDYTITWSCTFNVDGKTEEVFLLTDDFEDVYAEYLRLKTKHRVVVFVKHELHTKGKMVFSKEMFGIPVEKPPEPVIDAEQPPHWMPEHNRQIAARRLREPNRI